MPKNPSIKCSVQQCKYNDQHDSYCTLSDETNPTVVECTDCQSFVCK